MTRSSSLPLRIAALLSCAAIIAACTGTTPSASVAPTTAATPPPASVEPFDAKSYPEDGTSVCGTTDYTGQMGLIKATAANTVEFTLCAPDAAFLSKIALQSLSINDADYLTSTGGGGEALFRNPNGTGPYKLKAWTSGSEIALETFDGYWGTKPPTKNAVIRWSPEAAQRLVELQSGAVDGIDNVGSDDFPAVEGNAELKLYPRTAMNVLYLGMNNTYKPWGNQKIRQAIAMGIDRQRIVDTFFPPGSQVASHFTPCVIPGGCGGDEWYTFDPVAAKALLAEGLAEEGLTSLETKLHLRTNVRCYFPTPPDVATDMKDQLKVNLGIDVTIDPIDPTTYLGIASRGELPGLFFLGWCADYPDVTNFLDVFFGTGADKSFGDKWDEITGPLTSGGQTADAAARADFYTTANNAIRELVPAVPLTHGGSATAFRADVEGGHSSPLNTEILWALKAGDRDTVVFMQNSEPGGLYCGDETDGEAIRVCAQIFESLYKAKVGGTEPEPSLAESCTANTDSTVWTCTLREGVTFHDGATLDANDVVLSYAVEWDAKHPLHKGREGLFEYWTYIFAAFLNPPPPAA